MIIQKKDWFYGKYRSQCTFGVFDVLSSDLLPTSTKEERKQYSRFRKNLIKNGFVMMQFSVYARTTRNNDDAKKYATLIKTFLPPKGSVRVLTITDRQYDTMEILLGEKYAEENYLDKRDILEL